MNAEKFVISGLLVFSLLFISACSDQKMEKENKQLKSELSTARERIVKLEEELKVEKEQNQGMKSELQGIEDRIFTLRVNWRKCGQKTGETLGAWYESAGEGLDALGEEIGALKHKVFGLAPTPIQGE